MVAGGVVANSGSDEYRTLRNNTNKRWVKDKGLRRLNIGIGFMFSSAAANGFDGSLMNGLLALPQFTKNLGDVSANILGLILAGISLGGTPTFIPASYFADYYGRRTCVGIGSLIMVCGAIAQAATHGRWAFFGTRIMMGVGLGFAQTAAPPLTTEVAHPRHRGAVTTIFQAIYYWGAIVSAAVILGTLHVYNSWSWRVPCLLQALFPGIQLLGLAIIPESPRWLVSQGRSDEALHILARYHANGDVDDCLVQFEFNEICAAIEIDKALASKNDWISFVSTAGARRRLAICILVGFMIQWAGTVRIVSYYLAPILADPTQQAAINLGLQIWNAIWAACGAIAAEKYGRRPLWMISTVLMLIFFVIITALSAIFAEKHIKGAGSAVVAFLFLFFGSYDIAYTPLSIACPVEILPFYLRAKGLSLNLTVVFATGFFNQYVNPIALSSIAWNAWKFYFVYVGCLFSFIFIIYFLFPETKGRTLEEIAIVFDGAQAEIDKHLAALGGTHMRTNEFKPEFEQIA
ncbi:general substrate transporter [Lipomyces starkeyi]